MAFTITANISSGFDIELGAVPLNLKINIGDVWKDVAAVKINIGDVWKDVVSMQINIS